MTRGEDTTSKILAAMERLGPADVRTITEISGAGRSTVNRKLNDMLAERQVARIDRGDNPPHWTLPLTFHRETAQPDSGGRAQPQAPEPDGDGTTSEPAPPDITATTATEPETATARPAAEPATATAQGAGAEPDPSVTLPPQLPDEPAEPVASGNSHRDVDLSGPAEPPTAVTSAETAPARQRRATGVLKAAALQIMRANPNTIYKPLELARLVEAADLRAGATPEQAKVSNGAMIQALNKAAGALEIEQVTGKPQAYRAVRD